VTKKDEMDRRRGERVRVNAEFASLGGSGTYVSNLSEHGVFVHTQQVFAVGSKIELRFTVLLDDPVVICGLGTVIRCSEDPPGLGVELGPLSPETVLRINDVVSRQRPRDAGDPLPSAEERVFSTRDVAARSLTTSEFESLVTGRFPRVGGAAATSSGEYEALDDSDIEEIEDGARGSGGQEGPDGRTIESETTRDDGQSAPTSGRCKGDERP
jgi:Tfp pilus assembly protein PilZ